MYQDNKTVRKVVNYNNLRKKTVKDQNPNSSQIILIIDRYYQQLQVLDQTNTCMHYLI